MPQHPEARHSALGLAWDTATLDGVVVAHRGREVVAQARFRTVKGHAGWLMPIVASTLEGAGLGPGDLRALAVGTGPGGYTGVKVGVSTAKALALALELPLAGVPTLDLLAAHAPGDGPVLACMDAGRGLLYAAGYGCGGLSPARSTDYVCLEPAAVARLAKGLGPSIDLIGGTPQLADEIGGAGVEVRLIDQRVPGFPSPERLAGLASSVFGSGGASDAFGVVPIYLKKPV